MSFRRWSELGWWKCVKLDLSLIRGAKLDEEMNHHARGGKWMKAVEEAVG
jgi:hypothetical protein